jgi:ABC-2 type transport system permease protein
VVRNLNTIKTQFVSSIDTIEGLNITKTVLLKTSPYSRRINMPAQISLSILRDQPDERLFQGPAQNIAVLLEGRFESEFRNRIPPEIASDRGIGFQEVSVPTSMIVVSDGDIIRNQFHIPSGEPLALGYDQFTRETFGNKDFILNALNYLTDGPGLISIRSRELKLRLLDRTKINNYRVHYQVANVLVPVLIVVLIGILLIWMRKRKYSR